MAPERPPRCGLLCGLLDPTEGEAWVAGHNVARELDAVKDQIGYMAQRFGLYGDLTVDENMNFYADLFGISKPERDHADAATAPHDPHGAVPQTPGRQSFGRHETEAGADVHACCIIPQVLFLDEPTNGVDPVSRRDFWAILYQLVRDGLTVFVTTAYLDEAERCNRVGLMNQGRMIRCESPQALKHTLEEICYEMETSDQRAAREFLQSQPGVLSVEPAGAKLHLFLNAGHSFGRCLEQALRDAHPGPIEFRPHRAFARRRVHRR